MSSILSRLGGKTNPNADRIPPGQTETKGFPVLTYGQAPRVKTEDWTCRVFGRVAKPHTFTWGDLLEMPQTTVTSDIHCVTRWSKLDTTWTGVRFSDFLAAMERATGAALDATAAYVVQHATGGYTTNTTLEMLLEDNVLIAHTFDGAPLDTEHGGPVRMVVPRYYFWKSAKWLNGFEFLDSDRPGFWERYGYHNEGDPWKEERYS